MSKRLRSPSPIATVSSRKTETASSRRRLPISLFIFRRDLRVEDNTALIQLASRSPLLPILPVFFFNPSQIDPQKNPYYGQPCVQFMMESLLDLNEQLDGRLCLLRGSDEACITSLQSHFDVRAIGFNKDYTPFAVQRDEELVAWCKKHNVSVEIGAWDYSLLPLDGVVSGSGNSYGVFTPFYKKCMSSHLHQVLTPNVGSNVLKLVQDAVIGKEEGKGAIKDLLADEMLRSVLDKQNPLIEVQGGRTAALERLKKGLPSLKHYETERDYILPPKTSMLSPYMKFGCVSVREVFAEAKTLFGVACCFVKELFWREFYAMLLYTHPMMCRGQLNPEQSNLPFQEKFATFDWSWKTADHWTAFMEGRTGVPLVDASVRCLNATGWCHNRTRMVIGSFATKVLFIDWRVCERWFATKSVDYDVASNNGGWQWCSGQGADAMPYFRTFNPFTQSKKFDEDCSFVKKWIPELKDVECKIIHAWDEKSTDALVLKTKYPKPIVDVKANSKKVIAEYQKY